MPPVYMNGRQLADRLDRPYEHVMDWSRLGLIPSIKLSNGRVVFDLDRVVQTLMDQGDNAVTMEATAAV